MISGESVTLSLAALCLGEDGLVIAILFRRTFCELLRAEKTFSVQFSEPSLQILGGFTPKMVVMVVVVLFISVAVSGCLLLLLPLLGYTLSKEKGGGDTCWI